MPFLRSCTSHHFCKHQHLTPSASHQLAYDSHTHIISFNINFRASLTNFPYSTSRYFIHRYHLSYISWCIYKHAINIAVFHLMCLIVCPRAPQFADAPLASFDPLRLKLLLKCPPTKTTNLSTTRMRMRPAPLPHPQLLGTALP